MNVQQLLAPAGYSEATFLGRGQTTSTFLVARADGTHAVCKRLLPRAARDDAARAALTREGRILAALSASRAPAVTAPPATPRFVEAGDDDHGPYLVMEYLPLRSLEAHLPPGWAHEPASQAHARSPEWLVRFARGAFAALDQAHAAGDERGPLSVLHGDISPENLLASDDASRVVVIDFGLGSYRDDRAPHDGSFRGTILYAAPWLARGEPLDSGADRFALAATLAHALLGVPPRHATTEAALLLEAGEAPIDAYAARAAEAFRALGAEDVASRIQHDLVFERRHP